MTCMWNEGFEYIYKHVESDIKLYSMYTLGKMDHVLGHQRNIRNNYFTYKLWNLKGEKYPKSKKNLNKIEVTGLVR